MTLSRRRLFAAAAAAAALLVLGFAALASSGGGEVDAETTTTAPPATTTTTEATTTTTAPEVHPLTGEVTDAPRSRPALAVKIENSAASRPQLGLEQADVVFEEMVEGGITRFVALFHSQDPGVVGPVRSVRPMDAPIVAPLHPLFAYSGGIGPFVDALRAVAVDVGAELFPGSYHRVGDRRAPHNLMTDTAGLWGIGASGARTPAPLFEYLAAGAVPGGAGSVPVGAVDLRFSASSMSSYSFDAPSGRWLRFQDGRPHMAASGTQLSAANVVVLSVQVADSGFTDTAGTPVPETLVIGSGPAWVLTGGQVTAGTWSKPEAADPAVLTDADGEVIALAPGPSWVHLVPAEFPPAFR